MGNACFVGPEVWVGGGGVTVGAVTLSLGWLDLKSLPLFPGCNPQAPACTTPSMRRVYIVKNHGSHDVAVPRVRDQCGWKLKLRSDVARQPEDVLELRKVEIEIGADAMHPNR